MRWQDIPYALWVPHGTPNEARLKLRDAVGKSLAKPGIAKKFEEMGTRVKFAGPDEVARITVRKTQNFNTAIEKFNVNFGG